MKLLPSSDENNNFSSIPINRNTDINKINSRNSIDSYDELVGMNKRNNSEYNLRLLEDDPLKDDLIENNKKNRENNNDINGSENYNRACINEN